MSAVLAASLMATPSFGGGNQSVGSVLELLKGMANDNTGSSSPASGGTLSVNGNSLGSYDYVVKVGDQTVSSFSDADWFTSTEDSRSAFIVVVGNLTVNSGQVFTPGVRKLFTAIYVTGALTINGEISMTARGANHSSTGSNIAAADIRLAAGTYDGVSNPQVPATGGAGGASVSSTSGYVVGNPGVAGSDGGTGGGGGGAANLTGSGTLTSGGGSPGTSFSGGVGGGGFRGNNVSGTAQSAAINGGKGGNASSEGGTGLGGAAGNPAGNSAGSGGVAGVAGTGGVLFIACGGALSGSGSITAEGSSGGTGGSISGASGGGSITVIAASGSVTLSAATGAEGVAGGAGTARILEAAV